MLFTYNNNCLCVQISLALLFKDDTSIWLVTHQEVTNLKEVGSLFFVFYRYVVLSSEFHRVLLLVSRSEPVIFVYQGSLVLQMRLLFLFLLMALQAAITGVSNSVYVHPAAMDTLPTCAFTRLLNTFILLFMQGLCIA